MARPLFTSVRRLVCSKLAAATLLLLTAACGGRQAAPDLAAGTSPQPGPFSATAGAGFDLALPVDRPMPWDGQPHAGAILGGRQASGLNADSVLVLGSDYFAVGGPSEAAEYSLNLDTDPLNESGGSHLAYAIYRLEMGGQEPGVLTVDASQDIYSIGLGGPSGEFNYWVGASDYTAGAWHWYGPFSDSNIRIPSAKLVRNGRSLLSPQGNTFVAVLAYGGPEINITAVGASPLDPLDNSAPPAPTLLADPMPGGAVGSVVIGAAPADLAGQRVYYSTADFSAAPGAEVKHLESLNGMPQFLVPGKGSLHIGITNLDISGNESAMSKVIEVQAGSGEPNDIRVAANSYGGKLSEVVHLFVAGDLPEGCEYQYDFDGDGVTDQSSPTMLDPAEAQADTSRLGIIRPAVRVVSEGGDGVLVAQGSTSLVITANLPPIASLAADRTLVIRGSSGGGQGVEFDASSSIDPNGEGLTYYFAFEGGGDYGNGFGNPVQTHYYNQLGSFVCLLKVKNTAGLYATDSLGIQVQSMAATRLSEQGAPLAEICDIAGASYETPPGIAYYDSQADAIKVQRAVNGAATSWTPPETAVDNLTNCDSLSLFPGTDELMLAYCANGDLLFTETINAGFNWEAPVTVRNLSGGRDAGHSCTMLVLDGYPNIAYFEEEVAGGSVALKYVQTNVTANDSWLNPTTCAAGLPQEVYTTRNNLAACVITGNAAVAYAASGEIRYKRSFYFQNQVPLWPADPVVLSVNGSGNGISMLPVVNTPAVLFNTPADGTFYIHALDDGDSWDAPVQISTRNNGATALARLGNNPCALLVEAAQGGAAYFCSAFDRDGLAWELPVLVTALSGSDSAAMIVGGNGKPLAAFTADEPEGASGVYAATLSY